MNRSLVFMFLGFILLFNYGCWKDGADNAKSPTSPDTAVKAENGTVSLKVTYAPRNQTAKPAAVKDISRVTAYVYYPKDPRIPSAEIVSKDLTIANTHAAGTIEVTAQENLWVVLACYYNDTVRYLGENTDVDVYSGKETQAGIYEEFMGVNLTGPAEGLAGVPFTLTCLPVSFATKYEFWEARSSNYSDAVRIGNQTSPKFEVPAKDSSGVYYYRARVTTPYGPGPWTVEGETVVRIENGSIVIDITLPEYEKWKDYGITLADIPGGTFKMGAGYSGNTNSPEHNVTLSQFQMSTTEISRQTFEQIMEISGNGGNFPAGGINYLSAIYFCNYLSEKCGLDTCYNLESMECNYNRDGFRLPTEAEWEYACRAGSTTWWSDINTVSINQSNSNGQYWPVGSVQPNPWGLYDMLGNVYEWCNDWYGPYTATSVTNPTGPSSGTAKTLRGGAYETKPADLNPAQRLSTTIYLTQDKASYGFRVVRRPQ